MPTKPTTKTLNANSVDVLNAVRNSASPEYQASVPVATASLDSIREIGTIVMDYKALKNEFLSALVNRIGRVILTSKLYDNPWSVFKRGMLEYGETVEEIFTNIAKPFQYNPEIAEEKVWKRVIPDVRAAFHSLNYQKFYKVTVQDNDLRQAFLSWDGVTELINSIITSMYTAANYDEFLVMKYLIAKMAVSGGISSKTISSVNAENSKGIVSTIKGISNSMEFMSSNYNMAGVKNFARKRDQYIILTAAFDAIVDVEVLASAFNLDKAEFMGNRMLVDTFDNLDTARLAELFADDTNYTPLTSDELSQMSNVQAVIVDKDWFMIFDVLIDMEELRNPEGLYWNYWLHNWKILSVSPFANAVMFTTETSTVTGVTVSPTTASVTTGSTTQFTATVAGTGLYNKGVIWSINDTTDATIDGNGLLTVQQNAQAGTITVTATSIADSTQSGTATVTVGASTASTSDS